MKQTLSLADPNATWQADGLEWDDELGGMALVRLPGRPECLWSGSQNVDTIDIAPLGIIRLLTTTQSDKLPIEAVHLFVGPDSSGTLRIESISMNALSPERDVTPSTRIPERLLSPDSFTSDAARLLTMKVGRGTNTISLMFQDKATWPVLKAGELVIDDVVVETALNGAALQLTSDTFARAMGQADEASAMSPQLHRMVFWDSNLWLVVGFGTQTNQGPQLFRLNPATRRLTFISSFSNRIVDVFAPDTTSSEWSSYDPLDGRLLVLEKDPIQPSVRRLCAYIAGAARATHGTVLAGPFIASQKTDRWRRLTLRPSVQSLATDPAQVRFAISTLVSAGATIDPATRQVVSPSDSLTALRGHNPPVAPAWVDPRVRSDSIPAAGRDTQQNSQASMVLSPFDQRIDDCVSSVRPGNRAGAPDAASPAGRQRCWRTAPDNLTDIRIWHEAGSLDRGPTRLWVALHIHGDGHSTPAFTHWVAESRSNGWERLLPEIYQQQVDSPFAPSHELRSGEPTRISPVDALLGLFEAAQSDVEDQIDAMPDWFNAMVTTRPAELAHHLGIESQGVDEPKLRTLLSTAWSDYETRGTSATLQRNLELITGIPRIQIEEPICSFQPWLLGNGSRLGDTTVLATSQGGMFNDHECDPDPPAQIHGVWDDLVGKLVIRCYEADIPFDGGEKRLETALDHHLPAHVSKTLQIIRAEAQVGNQAQLGIDAILGGRRDEPECDLIEGTHLASTVIVRPVTREPLHA